MAASTVSTSTTATAKSLQEMPMNGVNPPPPYFIKENTIKPMDSFLSPDPIPTIDIGLLSSSERVEDELLKLKSALPSWSCFQAIGHGISSSFECLQKGHLNQQKYESELKSLFVSLSFQN